MRVVRLVLLGLVVYLIAMVLWFPAAPVIEKIKPQLQPLALSGVSGGLFNGEVASVVSTDDLLPLELTDVKWRFAPTRLLKGTGAAVEFTGFGGGGTADVIRTWGNDIEVDNVEIDAVASEFESFLPVPIASFKGNIRADVGELRLVNNQLKRMLGKIRWNASEIDTSVFGDVQPQDDGSHQATVNASGGDITADGTVTVAGNGDFNLNILLTPSSNTPQSLIEHLKRTTRPESGGRYRWQERGNVNRLM